jgi:dTMP kinase
MIACDVGRGMVMALIPFTNDILTLLLATLVIEVMSSLFAPAKDAVLPTLVRRDQLVVANQINLLTTYGTLPLAGVLFAATMGLAGPLSGTLQFLADRPVALPIWMNAAVVHPLRPADRQHPHRRCCPSVRHRRPRPPARGTSSARGCASSARTPHPRADPRRHGRLRGRRRRHLDRPVLRADPQRRRDGVRHPRRRGRWGARRRARRQHLAVRTDRAGAVVLARHRDRRHRARRHGVHAHDASRHPARRGDGGRRRVAFIVGYTILQSRSDDHIRGRTFGAFNSGVRAAIFLSTTTAPFLVGVIGREPRVDGVYPYAIGGVRLSLAFAGLLAVGGAVFTHLAFRRAVDAHPDLHLEPIATTGPTTWPGLFLVFEGGDGAGKTTQIRLLRSAIERTGRGVLVTREPGGTRVGETIRDVLLRPDGDPLGDRAEALLYAAARAQHVEETILPALEDGEVVLCDRFVDSSVVYQGAARGLGESHVAELNRWATDGVMPDLVILLDVDPVEGLRRVGDQQDRLESAGLPFHRSVAAAYRRRAEEDPDRYLVLDAGRPVEELHAAIRDAVLARLQPVGDLDEDGPPPRPDAAYEGEVDRTVPLPHDEAARTRPIRDTEGRR